jgi:hypothetical protein
MPKDRDQMTPADPEDRERMERSRGQGTGGTGKDVLPTESRTPGEVVSDTSTAD